MSLRGPMRPEFKSVLAPEAIEFLVELHRRFDDTRLELLHRRKRVAEQISQGDYPTFLPETRSVREGDWKCAPIPADLLDRRVEITGECFRFLFDSAGPVSRKMVINALNSGANTFMADFEDANSPTWENNLDGQINLRDAVNGTISTSVGGREYQLNPKHAVLIVRSLPGDTNLQAKGSGPYFYIPKLESHLEARLWNDVFLFAESKFKLPNVIRATILIETICAAFEMDEILYEVRDHSSGLNCGRWDYIFSVIKKFIHDPRFVMGDRAGVTMTAPFMDAYVRLLIKTCHRRGVHAMGGMAAQIPIRDNKAANDRAMEKVRNDKLREVIAGHDGTWVAHPGLIPVTLEAWNQHMTTPNQIDSVKREDVHVTAKDLLDVPQGVPTMNGVRTNCRISMLYLESWLKGNGCIPVDNLMEDLATAEISRSQLFQWIKHGAVAEEKYAITHDFVSTIMAEEYQKLASTVGADKTCLANAFKLLIQMIDQHDTFPEFMSLPAYPFLCHFSQSKI